jgi:hypothetical protein
MRRAIVAVVAVALGAVGLWAVFARDAADRDLAAELATGNAVLEVPAGDLTEVAVGDELDLSGEVVDTSSFGLFDLDTGSADLVAIDPDEADQLVDTVRYFRSLSETPGIRSMIEEATHLVILSEIRLQFPAGAPPRTFRVIALGPSGHPIDSDWHGTSAEEQFLRLSDAIQTAGLDWPHGLAAVIRAQRDRELGRDSTDPVGAGLLAAIRGEG